MVAPIYNAAFARAARDAGLIVCLGLSLVACRKQLVESGFAKKLNAISGVSIPGTNHSLRVQLLSGGLIGTRTTYASEKHFSVVGTLDDAQELSSACREWVKGALGAAGIKCSDGGFAQHPTGIKSFWFSYNWQMNEGFVRAYIIRASTNEFTLIINCYEHVK